jgi:glycosyltransferase involved in cell wall biosynthesis
MTHRVSIILPTYNEADNIRPLCARLARALGGLSHEIIFVDESTDGTDRQIAELARHSPQIRLIHHGERRGLAAAVVEGIQAARGEAVCVLDADLQHPPEVVPALVEALDRTRADLAVASRYIPGGSYEGLTPLRRLMSLTATGMARTLLLRARAVTDPMSGFFAFRRGIVEGVPLRPLGFKILLEVLVRGRVTKIVEVPYRFELRRGGESKLTMRQNAQFLRHLISLSSANARQRSEAPPAYALYQPGGEAAAGNGDAAHTAVARRRGFVRYLKEGPVPALHITPPVNGGAEPKVSILIPTANRSRAQSLERLLRQIHDQSLHQAEVIVVEGDRRQGRAINTAAAIARGDFLVTMDDDTQLGDPRVLEHLVAAMEQDPTIGIAGAASAIPDDAPPIVRRAMRELPRRSSAVLDAVTESDMAEHPCLAIRRRLFYQIGGEHELIPRGLDPYLRAEVRRLGYRVVVVPDTWIHHLLPATLRGILRQYYRNGVGAAYVKKFYPGWVIEQAEAHGEPVREQTSLPSRALRYLGRIGGAALSGRWVYLGTLGGYALGYAWGLVTLRKDSL